MKKNTLKSLQAAVLGGALLLACSSAQAIPNTITYVNWTSETSGASGSVNGTLGAVNVTYSGDVYFAQVNNSGIQYWTQPNPSSLPYTGNAVIGNAPSTTDIIALNQPGARPGASPIVNDFNTLTFSQAILNPVMLINSLGQGNANISYIFNQTPTLLSVGQGYWGGTPSALQVNGATLTLSGQEGTGAIQFLGLISSISWTTTGTEDFPSAGFPSGWEGITVGADVPSGVPDGGATIGLLGMGMVGLASLRKWLARA
jgi:hypothetical protein